MVRTKIASKGSRSEAHLRYVSLDNKIVIHGEMEKSILHPERDTEIGNFRTKVQLLLGAHQDGWPAPDMSMNIRNFRNFLYYYSVMLRYFHVVTLWVSIPVIIVVSDKHYFSPATVVR
jgi:hypothetical protein